jgi:hypothetical protein
MDKQSQLKVLAAGFTIMRPDDQPSPRIKFIDKNHHEWTTLLKFETKAARDRKLKELFEVQLFIID